uniref:Uncharacterized protein n=1 Tax=Cyprinus carpio TaxID=7962 RepID=A0A8C1MBK8_CYPCA
MQDLFGLKISSLLLAHPEVSEGSADEAPPPSRVFLDLLGRHRNSLLLAHPEVSEGSADEAPPPSRVFLDLLGRHRKLQGRSRKGVGRGCFGMKVDRIGVISGLGC